ncbi:MAG: polyphosphate polymerase domain-containing protein [Pleomorphochaeta sp.]
MKLRHEHKFLVEYDDYMRIRHSLTKVMNLDKNSIDNKGYHIRSVYFDDIYENALYEKLSGISERKKYRVRIYNFSDNRIKLEIKKKFQDFTNKIGTDINKEEYYRLYNGDINDYAFSDNLVKRSYYIETRNNLLRPKVIVDYYREAFTLPYNEVRITFDLELEAVKPQKDIFSDSMITHKLPPMYSRILEVKYNNFLPTHIKSILEPYNLTRLSVSKFLLCRDIIQ